MRRSTFQHIVITSLHVLSLVILASCFSLQQLIAYSNPCLVQGSVPRQGSSSSRFQTAIVKSSASLPNQCHPLAIDVELEPSGNDDSHEDDTHGDGDLSREHASKEKDLTNGLRIRLQHLTTMARRHEKVPCFILHHSWKAHLA